MDPSNSHHKPYEGDAVIMPLLRWEKLRHREVEKQPRSTQLASGRAWSPTWEAQQQNLPSHHRAGHSLSHLVLALGVLAWFALKLPTFLVFFTACKCFLLVVVVSFVSTILSLFATHRSCPIILSQPTVRSSEPHPPQCD